MGTYYKTHIGPFIRATYHYNEVDDVGTACPNEQCGQYKKKTISRFDFCPYCSTATTQMVISKEQKASASFHHIMDAADMVDDLQCYSPYKECVDLLFANYHVPGINRRTSFSHGEKTGVLLTQDQIDMEGEKKTFAEFYSKQIQLLSKHYDTVVVEWGVVTTAN